MRKSNFDTWKNEPFYFFIQIKNIFTASAIWEIKDFFLINVVMYSWIFNRENVGGENFVFVE